MVTLSPLLLPTLTFAPSLIFEAQSSEAEAGEQLAGEGAQVHRVGLLLCKKTGAVSQRFAEPQAPTAPPALSPTHSGYVWERAPGPLHKNHLIPDLQTPTTILKP